MEFFVNTLNGERKYEDSFQVNVALGYLDDGNIGVRVSVNLFDR